MDKPIEPIFYARILIGKYVTFVLLQSRYCLNIINENREIPPPCFRYVLILNFFDYQNGRKRFLMSCQ